MCCQGMHATHFVLRLNVSMRREQRGERFCLVTHHSVHECRPSILRINNHPNQLYRSKPAHQLVWHAYIECISGATTSDHIARGQAMHATHAVLGLSIGACFEKHTYSGTTGTRNANGAHERSLPHLRSVVLLTLSMDRLPRHTLRTRRNNGCVSESLFASK